MLRLRRNFHFSRHFLLLKPFSTAAPPPPLHLPLSHPTYIVWGSNTSVGKTLVSAGLASSFLLSDSPSHFLFLKPIQTGFPSDSDSRFVFHKLSSLYRRRHARLSLLASDHVLNASLPVLNTVSGCGDGSELAMCELGRYEEQRLVGEESGLGSRLICKTMYAWKEAVSPHLAAERESGVVDDALVIQSLQSCLNSGLEVSGESEGAETRAMCLVETAGGVASPGPSGSLQCDLYRPFRLPCLLVGDGRLGGISGTISAYETLKLRGYDVAAIIFADNGLENEVVLSSHLRDRVPILVLPPIPVDITDDLMDWFDNSQKVFDSLKEIMLSAYSKRLNGLREMPKKAKNIFWWPFTQHKLVPDEAVTVIDSRCGENFTVFKDQGHEFMTQQFDACASWWTQGPDAALQLWPFSTTLTPTVPKSWISMLIPDHPFNNTKKITWNSIRAAILWKIWDKRKARIFSNKAKSTEEVFHSSFSMLSLGTELASDMGYAAARFGHVMFPENVYEPALECAELLLAGVGKDWASRVYFSDNGSTAIEIALKMAFRKFSIDHGILDSQECNAEAQRTELMLVVEERLLLKKVALGARNLLAVPLVDWEVLALNGSYHGDTLGAMEAQAPSCYTGFLQQPWYSGRGVFLDPPTVYMHGGKWYLSLPVGLQPETLRLENAFFNSRDEVFDEKRDGSDLAEIYSAYLSQQLSYSSKSKSLLGALIMEPVIQGAGGMHMVDPLFQRVLVKECQDKKIPVIFDEVFTGFWRLGTETAAELLHCVPDIACFAKLMTGGIIPLSATLASNSVFESFIGDSKLAALLHGHSYSAHALGCTAAAKSIKWFKNPQTNLNINSEGTSLRELWDENLVYEISSHPAVKRVVALGTLFALELQADGSNAGYASLYARSLLLKLREDGIYTRPLGNVIYLMCGPCTKPDSCSQLLIKLLSGLDDFISESRENLESCHS
ncbi:bifunctional dethiobiotin synthetase/7,8-diamino-pelargonic acid aminotransferase [Cucumis melo var. makuwa]|uniref:Bifunctional dethiobiotin synthetase/7,8-diamino-pelargonic acid aminotransferase n=1 Tax=Cucumis melo var. makuwa TaxID=1194695 RepID=A0A5D3CGJ8_CUCMM|nr:bifunctional dethiobiotin synthetase/7,8-diamino-pelargonic acid aminotransferase [Cucumis melo var. makuwa]